MKKLLKQFAAFIILNLTGILLQYYPYVKLNQISLQLTGDREFLTITGKIMYIVLTGIIPIFAVFLFVTLYEYLFGKINMLKVYITVIAVSLAAILIFYLIDVIYISVALFITATVFIFILLDYSLRAILIKYRKKP